LDDRHPCQLLHVSGFDPRILVFVLSVITVEQNVEFIILSLGKWNFRFRSVQLKKHHSKHSAFPCLWVERDNPRCNCRPPRIADSRLLASGRVGGEAQRFARNGEEEGGRYGVLNSSYVLTEIYIFRSTLLDNSRTQNLPQPQHCGGVGSTTTLWLCLRRDISTKFENIILRAYRFGLRI